MNNFIQVTAGLVAGTGLARDTRLLCSGAHPAVIQEWASSSPIWYNP